MPKHRTLTLSPEQYQELVTCRDHDKRSYMRERAAALLKIAEGMKAAHVADHGLLRRRDPDTVYTWLDRYQQEGLLGLVNRKGRGRKPAFSPGYQDKESAKEALLHVIRREPHCLGIEQTRWTLESLLPQLSDFRLGGPSSLWHLLDRLGIHWLRGREHVHSPDPLYQPKRAFIEQVNQRVCQSEGREIIVYQDECSYDRQPSLACAYAPTRDPARAERSHQSNTQTRIAGVLNAHTGAVQAISGPKVGIKQLVELYRQVCDGYAGVQRIWLVQDNWPVHFHPDVLVALEAQECPFPFPRPDNWPDQPSPAACKRWGAWHLPVQLVVLPTYASWCNPIEKLWRMLKQEILHLHRQADDLQGLRQRVMAFLQQFAPGSLSLLRYVGLLPN